MSKHSSAVSAGIFQPIISLTLMCDIATLDPSNPLMVAIIGPGPCILNVDPATIGLEQPRATRAQFQTMVLVALEHAQDSDVMRLMPPVCEGIDTVQLVAAFFLYSMEFPVALFAPSPLLL